MASYIVLEGNFQKQEYISLALMVVSAILVQLPGTVLCRIFMISLTLKHLENDSIVYFLSVLMRDVFMALMDVL